MYQRQNLQNKENEPLEIFFESHIAIWMCRMCVSLYQHPKIRCINYNACSIFRQTFPLKILLIQFCYLNFHSLNFSFHLFVRFGIFFADVHCFKLLFKLNVRTLKVFAIRFQFSLKTREKYAHDAPNTETK